MDTQPTKTRRPAAVVAEAHYSHLPDVSEVRTLDLYGRGFVLVLSQGADPAVAAKLAAAAQGRGMAVQAHALQDAAARTLYNRAYVLVRPDGHVAWSSDAPPAQPDALWARVSGHADAHPAPQA